MDWEWILPVDGMESQKVMSDASGWTFNTVESICVRERQYETRWGQSGRKERRQNGTWVGSSTSFRIRGSMIGEGFAARQPQKSVFSLV